MSIANQMSATSQMMKSNANMHGNETNMRKTNIRTGYSKLMSAKRGLVGQDNIKTMNPAKIAERDYLNRFSKIQQLDKQKQIKFAQYLGDRAMSEI